MGAMRAASSKGSARLTDQAVTSQLSIAQELVHIGKALATCLEEYVSLNVSASSLAILSIGTHGMNGGTSSAQIRHQGCEILID